MNTIRQRVRDTKLDRLLGQTGAEGQKALTRDDLAGIVREEILAQSVIVPGDILMSGHTANRVTAGFLKCDGAAVSRMLYRNLFAKIGTTYGVGDGSTTFNLPNTIGGFPAGFVAWIKT